MAMGNVTWEQHELNKANKQKKKVRREVRVLEEVKRARKKKRSSNGLTIARAYPPLWVAKPRVRDELPKKPNLHLQSIHCPLVGNIQ